MFADVTFVVFVAGFYYYFYAGWYLRNQTQAGH